MFLRMQNSKLKVAGVLAWTLVILVGPVGYAQNPAPVYAQADIAYGSRIYAVQCSTCHGPNGDAIAAVDLRAGRFQRVSSDNDLRGVVTNGIAGTAMPPFKFDASELAGIVAYIRNMRDFNAGTVAVGDPASGRAVFEGSGMCATCHRVAGKGSRRAPELTDIGAVRTAAALERSLLDPSGSMRLSNRSVRAVTRDGKVVAGRRLNEDTYTVQLMDEQERLVSLTKADLREYTVSSTTAMPSYKDKLDARQVADVVAYLLSLKGLQ